MTRPHICDGGQSGENGTSYNVQNRTGIVAVVGEYMALRKPGRIVRPCPLAIGLVVAFFVSFNLQPSARADEVCLKIALPELVDQDRSAEQYRAAMAKAGLCVDTVRLPNKRMADLLRRGEIDGVFAGVLDFRSSVGIPLVLGTVVGRSKGVLVTRDKNIHKLSDLRNQEIGVWLGAGWGLKELSDYADIITVPGGAEMMLRMMRQGRLDGVLIDDHSLRLTGGIPDGYYAIEVETLTNYSWLRKEYEALLPRFNRGTDLFRAALDVQPETNL
ncbi:MAG: hypothetical protein RIG26_00075 [Thalassospira sp.]|uniref:substrate-binding periplasmic protein n=1 Tax=Thalassospira sp. TaxID=1912094 RepID=UPI0032ECFB3B